MNTVHILFDALAAVSALAMTLVVYRWRLTAAGDRVAGIGVGYVLALVGGAVAGGYLFGTLNLWVSGQEGVGRSILGALAGAIAAIETYKWRRGLSGSTGIVFVPAFATSVTIGRIGCYLAGLEDFTHGVPTALPWGVDFGDGVARHPVQLYESAAMGLFLAFALVQLWRRDAFFLANGFYLMVGWYAAERFAFEFLKPYGALVGPFNVFHLLSIALLAYACLMIRGKRHERRAA